VRDVLISLQIPRIAAAVVWPAQKGNAARKGCVNAPQNKSFARGAASICSSIQNIAALVTKRVLRVNAAPKVVVCWSVRERRLIDVMRLVSALPMIRVIAANAERLVSWVRSANAALVLVRPDSAFVRALASMPCAIQAIVERVETTALQASAVQAVIA
jgi:hypothetical protein